MAQFEKRMLLWDLRQFGFSIADFYCDDHQELKEHIQRIQQLIKDNDQPAVLSALRQLGDEANETLPACLNDAQNQPEFKSLVNEVMLSMTNKNNMCAQNRLTCCPGRLHSA